MPERNRKMSNLPKLILMRAVEIWDNSAEIITLEEAKYRVDFDNYTLVVVEDKVVKSYDELVQLASQEPYKDREFLNVTLILDFPDGG